MEVSIPEKTLEHWVSQYINYRFRAKAQMWWPTDGADVVLSPPWRPSFGKAFDLEIKTSTPASGQQNRHHVKLRWEQLERYKNGYTPVYYVLPSPPWSGVLAQRGVAPVGGATPSEMAYQRSGDSWFAEWLHVYSTRDLWRALGPLWAKAGARRNGNTIPKTAEVKLFTFDASSGNRQWAKGVGPLRSVPFRDFWTRMLACGTANSPAVFYTPKDLPDHASWVDIRQRLKRAARDREGGGIELLPEPRVPDEDGEYTRLAWEDLAEQVERPERSRAQDTRISVFLSLDALNL